MSLRNVIGTRWGLPFALAAMCLGGATWAVQDTDDAPPSTRPSRPRTMSGIVRPFNLLDDLTDEQIEQLSDLRADFVKKRRELEEEYEDQSMAVLTEEQRDRLEEIEEDRRAQAAERRRQREREREGNEDDDAGE